VGVVPWQPDSGVLRDPIKRADVNEAIDKLRAYVAQTWLSRGATTVAVTSPIGDEGKAFTAFGLASSLAQAGYKTLLVDFDLRHGHALLTAAESVEVARRADVVLLCTLYRETRLPLLRRATERVAAMEVPYSGLVYLGATANEALC